MNDWRFIRVQKEHSCGYLHGNANLRFDAYRVIAFVQKVEQSDLYYYILTPLQNSLTM